MKLPTSAVKCALRSGGLVASAFSMIAGAISTGMGFSIWP